MHSNRHLAWAIGLLPLAVLVLSTSTSAKDADPCEELARILAESWPEESQHSPDEVRAIIERGEADRCGELVSTISLVHEPPMLEPQKSKVAQTDEIVSDALIGTTVLGVNDEFIGEISDLVFSSDGQVKYVFIEFGGVLGMGSKDVIVDFDQLTALREKGSEKLRVSLDSTLEEIERMAVHQAEVTASAIDLAEVRASRAFVALDNSFRTDFAGFGILAFRRSPAGSLSERATHLCRAFLMGIKPVSILVESGTMPDQQVVTAWPIEGADQASKMNESAQSPSNADKVCNDAVAHYDWTEGDGAIREAVDFFRARGKHEVAERIASPDQDGPWLLAWAPGAEKGSTHDDVLVLAFDLTYVSTQVHAERAFQAWRVAIEQNPELWAAETIANETWNSAIIRWVNMIGRDLDFYKLMRP